MPSPISPFRRSASAGSATQEATRSGAGSPGDTSRPSTLRAFSSEGGSILASLAMPVGLLLTVGFGAAALIVGGEFLSAPATRELPRISSEMIAASKRLNEPIYDLSVSFTSHDACFRTYRGTLRGCNLMTGTFSDLGDEIGMGDSHASTVAGEPNGRMVLGYLDGSVGFHSLKEVEPVAVTRPYHKESVLASAIGRNGARAATGGSDGSLAVWDCATAEILHEFNAESGPVELLEFSPDEKWLLSSGIDNIVRIWDLERGMLRVAISGHAARVSSAQFTPNGKQVITASLDGTIRCWNSRTGKKVWCSEKMEYGLLAIDISPDGRRMISGGLDGAIRIWNARKLKVLAEFDAHPVGVTALELSPDAKTLVSAGYDGMIRRWDLETLEETGAFSSGPS